MERRHMNEIREIIYRLRQGQAIREVMRDMSLARNTVRKYRDLAVKEGLLDPEKPLPDNETLGGLLGPPPRPRHMRSTVEPFADVVNKMLDNNVEVTAIWQRLREDHGYIGGYSSVRRYVLRNRPKEPEVFCRIETQPGEEIQVDFGSAGLQRDPKTGKTRKAWVFVMTLSWSRHQYVEFVFDQKIETWLRCHENAFKWFGGIPKKIVLDNLKAGVIKPDLHDPVLGEPYRRFAQHYGFIVSPNRPATPRHKGKVESGVRYVKRNFIAGQSFVDLDAMNKRGKKWVMEIAGVRNHGTTHETPLGRYNRVERETLQALPTTPFDLIATYQCKVHRDCHVVVDARYYSVPYRYVEKRVEVYVGRRFVAIYHGAELIATHPVLEKRGGRATRSDHYPENKREYLDNPPDRCRERAAKIGSCCSKVVESLLGDRVQDRLRSVQSLLRLKKRVGAHRLEKACLRAIHYGDTSYRRVKSILEARLDEEPLEPTSEKVVELAPYQFARPTSDFFEGEAQTC